MLWIYLSGAALYLLLLFLTLAFVHGASLASRSLDESLVLERMRDDEETGPTPRAA